MINIWKPEWILVAFYLFGIIYSIVMLGDFLFPDLEFIKTFGSILFSRVAGLTMILPIIIMAILYLIEIIPRIIRDDI